MLLTPLVTITRCIGINSLLCVPFSQLPEDYQSIIEMLQTKILPTTMKCPISIGKHHIHGDYSYLYIRILMMSHNSNFQLVYILSEQVL